MYSTNSLNKRNPYLVKEIMEANPKKLLLKVYDFAILNCQKRNMIKANEALGVLIGALRFDNAEASQISLGLMKIYQFCQDQMRKGNFEIAYKFLTELKIEWQKALKD
jgi:flagellar secretion chaperone FliS